MSDTWIEGKIRLEKAVGKDAADDILLEGYDKILVNIKEDGSIITEKLDDTGNIKNKKGGIEMLRDTLKDKEYFLEYIAEEDRINKFETKLRNNEVREDRILNVRKKVYDLEFQILIAKYSMVEPIESLIDDYKLIAGKMEGFWDINLYEDMLWMLAIGIMLEIDKNIFDILAKLVEKHKVNDFLYNFIIHYRNEEVNYQNSNWLFEKPFKSLINVIMCNDNTKSCEFMKEYLLEQWYVGHNDMGWYECHKHQDKLYFGYWSFESGAIMKILGLDDSILKDVSYYPYDMVHFKNE